MKARGHHLGPFPGLHYQRKQGNRPIMELSVQLRYGTPLQQILTNVDQCKEKQKLLALFIHLFFYGGVAPILVWRSCT